MRAISVRAARRLVNRCATAGNSRQTLAGVRRVFVEPVVSCRSRGTSCMIMAQPLCMGILWTAKNRSRSHRRAVRSPISARWSVLATQVLGTADPPATFAGAAGIRAHAGSGCERARPEPRRFPRDPSRGDVHRSFAASWQAVCVPESESTENTSGLAKTGDDLCSAWLPAARRLSILCSPSSHSRFGTGQNGSL